MGRASARSLVFLLAALLPVQTFLSILPRTPPPPLAAPPFQIGLKNKILQEKIEAQEEMDEANAHAFPPEARFWSKEDVGHFLTTLGLRQYREAFAEAAVDGDFLLALDANDCADVLGVEHALHSKKLFLAIDKLRPLTAADRQKKASRSVVWWRLVS